MLHTCLLKFKWMIVDMDELYLKNLDVKLVDTGCEACGHQMLSLWTQDVKFQEP